MFAEMCHFDCASLLCLLLLFLQENSIHATKGFIPQALVNKIKD